MTNYITIAGQLLPSATCGQCGCRVWPIDILPAHERQHAIREQQVIQPGPWLSHYRPPIMYKGNKSGRPKKKDSDKRWPVGINVKTR